MCFQSTSAAFRPKFVQIVSKTQKEEFCGNVGPAKSKKTQFDILHTLMRRDDVDEVINACDAGREGELIFRTVYDMVGCFKPIKRLWISSMEDESIRQGFADLKPGRDYDGLHQSALCRSKADWLVGVNATRLFSVLYHRTLNVGRIMSPTLALIVQREADSPSGVCRGVSAGT